MTGLTASLAILGVFYVSWLITKFLVWLDGADGPREKDRPAPRL